MNAVVAWAKKIPAPRRQVLCYLCEYGEASDNCLKLSDVVNAAEAAKFMEAHKLQFMEFRGRWP